MTDSDLSDSNEIKAPHRSVLLAMTGIVAFIVVAFFAWDLLRPTIAPCDAILEQTAVQLQTKLKLLGAGTELKLGRTQVQELSEKAQIAAVNLKGCCIVMRMSKLDSKEFLQCKSAVSDYEDRSRDLEDQVDEAMAAMKAADEATFEKAIEKIEKSLSDEAVESERVSQDVPDGQLRLQAVFTSNTDELNACFDVFHAAQDIDGNRVMIERQCAPTARFSLKPGRYYVNTWYGNVATSSEFDVYSNEMTNEILDLNAGTLRMQTVLAPGTDPLEACFDVFHPEQDIDGNRVKVDRQCTSTARFYLRAGKYFVNTWYGNVATSDEFEVVPGEITNPVLDLNAGILRMQTVLAPGSDPLEACFDVFHPEQDIDGNRVKVDRQCTSTARFYLQAGKYFVNTWYGNAATSDEFEVIPGEFTNPILDLEAGMLRMQSALGAEDEPVEACFDVYHTAQDIDGNRVKVDRQCTVTARFYVHAGQYFVHSWAGSAHFSGQVEVGHGALANHRFLLTTQ